MRIYDDHLLKIYNNIVANEDKKAWMMIFLERQSRRKRRRKQEI